MMDNSYYGNMVGGQPYRITTGESLNFDNTPAIEHELMVQSDIYDQQLLSPTPQNQLQHKRQDSLFSISQSSGTISSGPSPQQAEAQPCLPLTHMSQQTQMPRSADMMRSASYRSHQSTGSYQQSHNGRHRASFGQIGTAGMSRSSTQHSRTSTGTQHLQTAPQSYAASAQPYPIGHSTWTSNDANYTMPATSATYSKHDSSSHAADLTSSMYTFGSDSAHDVRIAGLDGMGAMFGQDSDTNRLFGQDTPSNK
jgi:hypothetical protein